MIRFANRNAVIGVRGVLRALCTIVMFGLVVPQASAEPLQPDLIAWADPSKCYMHCGSIDTNLIRNKVLYRFVGALPNIGAGPLEIREVTHADATQDVYQRIYDSEGGMTEELIGSFPNAASIPPRHLFLPGIAQYNLRTVTPGNGVGPIVASQDKTSMAVVDSGPYNTSLPGAPAVRVYTSVSAEILGISIGYADVYGINLPGQWVEVTGLPNGQYWFEVIANPYGPDRIQESDYTNNTTRILVNLTVPEPQIIPGDYNQDDVVDAADYVAWRNTLGQNVSQLGTGADGNGNGVIDAEDYVVWRTNFGEADVAGGTSGKVPEPGAVVLTAFATIAVVLWQAHGRRATCRRPL